MTTAVIVDAIRTPGGKRGGKLKDWHPVDLVAEVLKALVERNNLDPALIDDVICRLCDADRRAERQRRAKRCVSLRDFLSRVPGTTIDRQCGSSQQAAHFAAQGVMAGVYDVAIAAGVESMTPGSHGCDHAAGARDRVRTEDDRTLRQRPRSPGNLRRDDRREVGSDSRGTRRLAVDSHMRAARATEEGRFENEIIPVEITTDDGTVEMHDPRRGHPADDHPRGALAVSNPPSSRTAS